MMYEPHNLILRHLLMLAVMPSVLGAPNANLSDLSPRTVYACEGNVVSIGCGEGLKIQVIRSNYGRISLSVCNEGVSTDGWDLTCLSTRSLSIVSDLCSNKTECRVKANNAEFGDTCASTYKYLEIEYSCGEGGASLTDTYPPETPRLTRTRNPSSVPPAESTPDARSGFPLPTTSLYSNSVADNNADSESWCEAKTLRSVSWPRARAGQTVMMYCPNNRAVRKAIWRCGVDPVDWINQPDLSQCTSPSVVGILDLIKETEERFSAFGVGLIADDILAFMNDNEHVFGGDLLSVMTAMQKLAIQLDNHLQTSSQESATHLIHKVNQAILETSNNLLNESRMECWYDIPQSLWPTVATTLLSTVEKCAFQLASVISRPSTLIDIRTNIVVEVRVVSISEPVEDQVFPQRNSVLPANALTSGESFIELSGKTVQKFGVAGLSKMVFATYKNLDKWLKPREDFQDLEDPLPKFHLLHVADRLSNFANYSSREESSKDNGSSSPTSNRTLVEYLGNKTVNTRIISASFVGKDQQRVALQDPVIFVMKHISEEQASQPSCVFWDYSKTSLKGRWSMDGCVLLEKSNASHTQCSCEHLTNFAVLMSVKEQLLTDGQKFSLSFLTYFGCILSIICLTIAFLTFQSFKNLKCDRNTIHKNLVINLCIAEVVFLTGIIQYETPVLCALVAGLLHYLFLVTFLWMCLEGIQLYVMLVEVFEAESSRIKWYYLSAYGIPAIIVLISAIANHKGYGTQTHCWLSTENGFIWAFVGPVCVIICINTVMLGIAIYVMCTHALNAVNVWKARQKTTFENMRSWIKGAVVLVVLLGLTWTFGIFYINEQSLVMAYLFTALNSTQGVFIFLFHCLMNEKVQKEYKRWVRHRKWLPEDLRVRCGGVRTSASITPIHSSSSGVNKVLPEQKISFEQYLSRLFSRNIERKRSSTTTLPSSSNNNTKRDYIHCRRSDCRSGSRENDSSQAYTDPTEDPYSYMESARLTLGPEEEFYIAAGDISVMEGSVADTEYLDDYNKRASSVINFDKYKIRSQTVASSQPTGTVQNRPPPADDSLRNGRPTRITNERHVVKVPDRVKQLMSFTNLGVANSDSSVPNHRINPPSNI